MRCKLCGNFFNTDNGFAFLFYFPEICPDCEVKFKQNLKKEIVPIDEGEIHYYYLYDLPLNLSQRTYLDRNLKEIYKKVLMFCSDYELVILIDDHLLKEMAKFWCLLKPFKKICFFSLQYLDISNWKFLE